MNFHRPQLALAVTLSTLALGAQASAYNFQAITPPAAPTGSAWQMYGMNDNGQILMSAVGAGSYDYTTANGIYDASNGTFTPLPAFPGADANSTQSFGINDSGQIVGNYHTPGNGWLGYLYSGGTFSTITPPSGPSVTPWAISNNGQIAGQAGPLGPPMAHGFVLSGGVYTQIDAAPYPANSTSAFDINNAGTVVGVYGPGAITDPFFNSFVDVHGVITTLSMPGYATTSVAAINDAGVIVGGAYNADGTGPGFILNGGVYTPLNAPGAVETYLYDINDKGVLSGAYVDANGAEHFFLATPVPEPSAGAMMVAGLAGLGVVGLRRRRRW